MVLKRLIKVFVVVCGLLGAGLVGCARTEKVEGVGGPTLDQAWQDFRLAEYDLAERAFARIQATAPAGSEEYVRATFGLANVWNLRRPGEDIEKAQAFYQQIIDDQPAHDLAPWCALALVRLQHVVPVGQDPDYAAVRKGYRAIIQRYPGHLAAKESTIYLNATLIATLDEAQSRQAVSNLNAFIATGSQEFLAPAYSLLAVGYTTLKQPELRLQAEIKAFENVEIDPANPFNEFAWAYWNIATIAEFEVGDFALARQYYQRLIDEYPVDIRTFPSQQALARMDAVEQALREGREYTP